MSTDARSGDRAANFVVRMLITTPIGSALVMATVLFGFLLRLGLVAVCCGGQGPFWAAGTLGLPDNQPHGMLFGESAVLSVR